MQREFTKYVGLTKFNKENWERWMGSTVWEVRGFSTECRLYGRTSTSHPLAGL